MMKNNGFAGALKLDGFYQSSQNTGPVSASDVSYDNSSSGIPASNVQQAIDAVAQPMQPAQLGLAFGSQDDASNSDGYGRNCLPGQYSLTVYSAIGSGVQQQASIISSTLIQNDTADDTSTKLDKSNIIVNSGSIAGADLSQATMISTYIQSLGAEFAKSVTFGNFLDIQMSRGPSTIVIAANSDASETVLVDAKQGCYIGNCTRTLTLKDRQFYISSFDDFYIQTLANEITSKCVYYDENSGRMTFGDAPTPSVTPQKASLAAGTQFGFTATGSNYVENVGYNNAPNYQVSNAAIINRTILLGQNLFPNATNTGSMQSCFFMGHNITASPTASFINSFIAANQLSSTNFPGTSGCVVIAPRASALTSLSGAQNNLSNSVIISPDIVTFSGTAQAINSEDLVISTGAVTVGQRNLLLCRTNGTVDMQQTTGNGHILLYNSDLPFTFGVANAFSNNIMLMTQGAALLSPANNNEFLCNSTRARWSLNTNPFSSQTAGSLTPLMFDKNTSTIAPYARSTSGFGYAPLVYNIQTQCDVSGGECRGTVTIPTEYQSATWVAKMTIVLTPRNPGALSTTLYTAGVTSITGNNTIRINVYQQAVGGALAHATVSVLTDVLLSW